VGGPEGEGGGGRVEELWSVFHTSVPVRATAPAAAAAAGGDLAAEPEPEPEPEPGPGQGGGGAGAGGAEAVVAAMTLHGAEQALLTRWPELGVASR
jgi:hypothetical protein